MAEAGGGNAYKNFDIIVEDFDEKTDGKCDDGKFADVDDDDVDDVRDGVSVAKVVELDHSNGFYEFDDKNIGTAEKF